MRDRGRGLWLHSRVIAVAVKAALASPLLLAGPATAQDAPVRYRNQESNRLVIHTQYGPLSITIEGSSQYTARFAQPDSIIVRYERFDVEQFCICGHVVVPTAKLLSQPTILRVDRKGRTTVLSSPEGDDRGGMATDPVMQFGGMFYRFPAALLSPRAEWDDSSTDSHTHSHKGTTDRTTVTRRGHYRVERDTIFDSTPAWVVTVRERVQLESHLATVQNDVQGLVTLDGEETGALIVAKDDLGALYRKEHGSFEGVLNIESKSQRPFAARMSLRYDATLQRVP
ncbi:MAG TPA: hypothetical protein VIH11_08035 [Gemmatimonadaceae bacterium]|nr:hypothetical protein [Gemmatimonadaceae bacterium]